MHIVYIIRSKKFPNEIYKGFTTNLKGRLNDHNEGNSRYTKEFKPWKLIFYAVFETKKQALAFEKYLKSASGIAFMRKRLIESKKKDIKTKSKNSTINKKKFLR